VQVVGFACARNPVGRPQRVVGRLGPGELAAGGGRPVGHGLRVPTSHLDGTSPRLPASRPTATSAGGMAPVRRTTSTWRDHLRHRHGTEAAAVDRGRRVDAQQEHLARLGDGLDPRPGCGGAGVPATRTVRPPGQDSRQGLSGDHVPKLIEFRHSLPETVVGKVLRRELRTDEQEHRPDGVENRMKGADLLERLAATREPVTDGELRSHPRTEPSSPSGRWSVQVGAVRPWAVPGP
jgi:hypothetical protein